MITAWHHPGFAIDLGSHIMPMQKFALVAEAIGANIRAPEPLRSIFLDLVHDPVYIEAIKTGEPRALAESQKFPWSAALWGSVLLTNGAVVAAARAALEEGASAALASGFHHASRDHGEGFCTFNGLVLAAEILRSEGSANNVAILDMDLHYGNGTASLIESRPWIRQLSIYGNDYWNNVAYRDVNIMRHEDKNNHHSRAIPAGADWETLGKVMKSSLPWLLDEVRPDLLIYQAGADYLQDDPYSPLALDHAALLERDRLVFRLVSERNIPVAWTLAGGYSREIEKVVGVHINTFKAADEFYG